MEVNNENYDVNSDPDVNINSWIFIDKHTLNESVNSKGQEGTHALTEDDLGSTESNSDSDGISIISETEELQSQVECCTCLSEIKKQDNESIDNRDIKEDNTRINEQLENLQISPKDSVAKNKIICFTTVTGICFLATYFFWSKTVETQKYLSETVIYSEHDYPHTGMTYNDYSDEVYDKQIWSHQDFNNTCDFILDLSQDKLNDFNSVDNFMQHTYNNINKDVSVPHVIQSTNFPSNNNLYSHKQKIANKKLVGNINNNKKDNTKMKNTNVNHKTKILKLKEKYLNKKYKYLMKKEKLLKQLEREINKLESKLRKTYRRMKKEKGNHFNKNKIYTAKNYKENFKKIPQQNVTGDWYHKMYSGRSEVRNKEKLSDWVFERSKIRSNLRGKENWYFSRAKSRVQFRFNEKYRPGKYKMYKSYRY